MRAIRAAAVVAALSVAGARDAAALQILSPAPDAIVTAGSLVTVTVGPSAGQTLQSAFGATADETAQGVPGTAPGTYTIQLHIPTRAVGPTFVFVIADLAGGGIDTESVVLTADPGPLDSLSATAPSVLSGIGQVARMSVNGVFADGITRELPTAEQGTTYRSTNEAVLGVDPSGRIQARSRGTAQIVVTNTHVVSGATATAGVTVRCNLPDPPDNHIPVASPGADVTVAPITVVHLDGSASADPDNDPITFEWTQESGRAVVLRDADTASPFFMAPSVTAPEVLEFSLVVSDSKGATTLPAIVRVTVQP
ncbi:MAG: PKD domain-containing protein [Betaproteobacteria bacterium]